MSTIDHQTPALHRILVVDDEEIVLVALRETLQRAGYQVITCLNAVDALSLLKEDEYSVIITDQQMPVMTGLEFLSQVKEIQPDATRILITAVLSLNTVIEAINKGEIYRFVVKPWLREELLATVKNACQRYELICKNSVLQATTFAMNEKLTSLNKQLEHQIQRVEVQNEQLASLNQALEENLHQSVELCVRTMQTFYPSLGSQARRTHDLTKSMAEDLGLSHEESQTLEIAALLHDIGLVGVPRQLIKQWYQDPASLDEAERALVEHHPILGQELAGFAHPLKEVGPIIRAHHERFDGHGFPDQLSGESIPWLARLLSVAVGLAECNLDASESLVWVEEQSGKFFDPEAVRILFRVLPKTPIPKKQREVLLAELQPGMVLAKGVYTSNGMLLIPDGQQLTETYIAKLQNHHRINPITQTLLVYC